MPLKPILTALAALSLAGCARAETLPASPVPPGPALWKVADEDTTIYLFGTIHALPPIVEWYDARIADALGRSGEVVTEVPSGAVQDQQSLDAIGIRALLPPGENLRAMLRPGQRKLYEAAMAKAGLEVDAFDRFEPWFAAMTLSIRPLLQGGYTVDSGVEKTIEEKAAGTARRNALETIDGQIAVFDALPRKSQIAFLMAAARNVDTLVTGMDAMVAEWLEGDAASLAALMNEGLSDRVLADALLYDRNRQWAGWIERRLDQPGTVFMAVGAGHLAGRKSVQDLLDDRGIASERVR